MGLIFGFLGTILTLCILALCVVGAVWESVRVNKDYKRLRERSQRRE